MCTLYVPGTWALEESPGSLGTEEITVWSQMSESLSTEIKKCQGFWDGSFAEAHAHSHTYTHTHIHAHLYTFTQQEFFIYVIIIDDKKWLLCITVQYKAQAIQKFPWQLQG